MTRVLENKKVLVIHPFSDNIKSQFQKRHILFENNEVLPNFTLLTIKAVQSLGSESTTFIDWFEALQWMKDEIDKKDYDICLIGAGAYGFPFAAHVKRNGKKAVHIGGSLQLFFGIIGKRWENEGKISGTDYPGLINENWVRPSANGEQVQNLKKIEGGAYW